MVISEVMMMTSRIISLRAIEKPSVCSACVVTARSSGVFIDVQRGSENAENDSKASVYAALANVRGIGRTRGRRVRILSPRPPFLKLLPLESNVQPASDLDIAGSRVAIQD